MTAEHLTINDQIDDLQNEIDRLRITAETGEQWAHICFLEAQKVNLRITNINSDLRAAFS